jgi:hypothetical protein
MTSNEKVINMKVVGNFKLYDLESEAVQNVVLKLQKIPDYGRVQKQFWDSESWWRGWLKILPYEISSAKTRTWRLMGLSRIHHEGSRGSQEPLDPRVLIWWPWWSLEHYILTENPIFWRHHQELRNCLPLGYHLQAGGLLYSTKKGQGRRRTKGRCSPLGRPPCAAAGGAPPCTTAAVSPRRGCRLSLFRRHIFIMLCSTSSSSLL